MRACPPDGLDDVIETPNTRGIGINVGQPHKLIDESLMGAPVVAEASEMRDYEIHVRVFRREHVYDLRLPSPIDEPRQTESFGGFADLPSGHCFKPMHL